MGRCTLRIGRSRPGREGRTWWCTDGQDGQPCCCFTNINRRRGLHPRGVFHHQRMPRSAPCSVQSPNAAGWTARTSRTRRRSAQSVSRRGTRRIQSNLTSPPSPAQDTRLYPAPPVGQCESPPRFLAIRSRPRLQSSTSLLDSLASFLSTFQHDLADVSGQIFELQVHSQDIDERSKGRKVGLTSSRAHVPADLPSSLVDCKTAQHLDLGNHPPSHAHHHDQRHPSGGRMVAPDCRVGGKDSGSQGEWEGESGT